MSSPSNPVTPLRRPPSSPATGGPVIVVDTSSSMGWPHSGERGQERRIDVLEGILAQVLPSTPDARVIAFATAPFELEDFAHEGCINLPEPGGSTALHLALDHAAQLRPRMVIVISDGEPDDPRAAIAAARSLGTVIHSYYCGDETNRRAISFLRDLTFASRGGRGQAAIADLSRPLQLTAGLRLLLAGPAR